MPQLCTPSRRGSKNKIKTKQTNKQKCQPCLELQFCRVAIPGWLESLPRLPPGQMSESLGPAGPAAWVQISLSELFHRLGKVWFPFTWAVEDKSSFPGHFGPCPAVRQKFFQRINGPCRSDPSAGPQFPCVAPPTLGKEFPPRFRSV